MSITAARWSGEEDKIAPFPFPWTDQLYIATYLYVLSALILLTKSILQMRKRNLTAALEEFFQSHHTAKTEPRLKFIS